jgi:hypothetical protein
MEDSIRFTGNFIRCVNPFTINEMDCFIVRREKRIIRIHVKKINDRILKSGKQNEGMTYEIILQKYDSRTKEELRQRYDSRVFGSYVFTIN